MDGAEYLDLPRGEPLHPLGLKEPLREGVQYSEACGNKGPSLTFLYPEGQLLTWPNQKPEGKCTYSVQNDNLPGYTIMMDLME